MNAAGGLTPPIPLIEEHDVTEIQVHCDIQLSDEQFESINSNLRDAGLPPIDSRRRQRRWATPGENGGFWEFHLELYILSGRNGDSSSLHFMVVANKAVRTEPTRYRRSRRTLESVRALVEALFREALKVELDCSVTWHSLPDSWPIPPVLPLNPSFPEESVIQEISGVIGGSTDGTVKFVVDKVATDRMMFHIWLGFKHELSLSPNIMVEVTAQGVSMLESINMWGK